MNETKKSKNSFKFAITASVGSGLEYYDFIIYGLMAKYLAANFFLGDNEALNILKVFSVFAAGYFIRPFAGLIFGIFADLYGRKNAFIIVMLIMSFSTFTIGLLPTYEEIGIMAPILLIICRNLQGISFGAELPGAAVIIAESSAHKSHGKNFSFIISSTCLGFLLASLVITILTFTFSEQEIIDSIWRAPFLLGGALALVSLYIRKNLAETPKFQQSNNFKTAKSLLKNLIKEHKINLLLAITITLFLASLVIINLYFSSFIIHKFFQYEQISINLAMTYSMVFSFIAIIFFGFFVDKFNKKTMLYLAMLGFITSLLPSIKILETQNFTTLLIFFCNLQFWLAMFFTSHMPILANIFPTKVRYSGVAFSYNFAFLIASFIPALCNYLIINANSPSAIYIIVTILIVAAIISSSALSFLQIKNAIEPAQKLPNN